MNANPRAGNRPTYANKSRNMRRKPRLQKERKIK
nr:MAG TPA: hypothetical protein [Caudoviricetes sp.]